MNIHIIPDDKYVDTFIEFVSEVDPHGENIFLVRDPAPFKYLNSPNVIEAKVGGDIFESYIKKLEGNDKIFIHYLNNTVQAWVANSLHKAKLHWVFWGGDFYDITTMPNIYDPLTAKYLKTAHPPQKLSRFLPLHYLRSWDKKKKSEIAIQKQIDLKKRSIQKIDFILHFNAFDFDNIVAFSGTKAKLKTFYYPSSNTMLDKLSEIAAGPSPIQLDPGKRKIWVGNSGYPENNHLDIFEILLANTTDELIVVPLSYGDKNYIEFIIEKGKQLFGNRFVPITQYLDYDNFARLLNTVDIAVMGHNRTQGVGNTNLFLLFKKKVFIKKDNTMAKLLHSWGSHFYDYEDLNKHTLNAELTTLQAEENMNIIISSFDFNKVRKYIKQLLTA